MPGDLPPLPLRVGEAFQTWDSPPEPQVVVPDPARPWLAVMGDYLRLDTGPDEAPIILDGPVPEPGEITVDCRPALEKIGVDLRFSIKGDYGGTSIAVVDFGDKSVLGSDYKIVVLDRKLPEGPTARVIAITHTNIMGEVKLVGHFDTVVRGNVAEAYMSASHLVRPGPMSEERRARIPLEAKAVLDGGWEENGSIVAVHVNPSYRQRNYGRLLWLLALSIHELDDIKRLDIRSDVTEDKKYPGQSFYEHLGARPVLFMGAVRSLDTDRVRIAGEWKKCSPTTVSDQWVEYLRSVFFHDEPKITIVE